MFDKANQKFQLACIIQSLSVNIILLSSGKCSIRIDPLIVVLAVLVLHRVDDVLATLQSQFYPKMRASVTTLHHSLHLQQMLSFFTNNVF